jgi:hypothetical protein
VSLLANNRREKPARFFITFNSAVVETRVAAGELRGVNMMTITKKLAFGVRSILVVSLAPWFVLTAVAQGNNDVIVCVGPDSILRSPESGICPSGSQQIKLSGPGIKNVDDDNDPTQPPADSKSDPLADIERRISNLEKSSVFEVVNKEGKVIFRVAPGLVQLYDSNGVVVAAMGASSEGGVFSARTPDAKVTAFVRALGERVGLRITEGGFPRLDLGRQEAGNYSFKIPLGDKIIAGIGESKAGTGALVVGDGHGRPRAAIEVNAGKGAADVFNASGNGVASLTESLGGGGLLVLTDANSHATVMMKANNNRYGVVMAFPPGFPYVPKSGLPGSYMLGCAAGPSCVP